MSPLAQTIPINSWPVCAISVAIGCASMSECFLCCSLWNLLSHSEDLNKKLMGPGDLKKPLSLHGPWTHDRITVAHHTAINGTFLRGLPLVIQARETSCFVTPPDPPSQRISDTKQELSRYYSGRSQHGRVMNYVQQLLSRPLQRLHATRDVTHHGRASQGVDDMVCVCVCVCVGSLQPSTISKAS